MNHMMNVSKFSLRLRVKVKVYNIRQSISQGTVPIDFHRLFFGCTDVGLKPFAPLRYWTSKWFFSVFQLCVSHVMLVSHSWNVMNHSSLSQFEQIFRDSIIISMQSYICKEFCRVKTLLCEYLGHALCVRYIYVICLNLVLHFRT